MHLMRFTALVGALSAIALGTACSDGTSHNGSGGSDGGTAETEETEGTDVLTADTDDPMASSSGAASADETAGPEPMCGNGRAEAAEECDGDDLGKATCGALGLEPGPLACSEMCTIDASGCVAAPVLELSFSAIKRFDFEWSAVPGASAYRLEQRLAPDEPFVQIGGDLTGESLSVAMPLHLRSEAAYRLRACNEVGCTTSALVSVMDSLVGAIGYFKASTPDLDDRFGNHTVLSADGNTLAVSAQFEGSAATGIDGDQADDSAFRAGSVYVFVRDDAGSWSQQAYVKASNAGAEDSFGAGLALSADGSVLAVSSQDEDGGAAGIDGDQSDDSVLEAGAVYVFERDAGGAWSQQAYVKSPDPDEEDRFHRISLSADGNTLAVGAWGEDGNAAGIDGDETDDSLLDSGAAYVFGRDGRGGPWSQEAYIKASNPGAEDHFGISVSLSADGSTLAVGADTEDSSATGIDGNQLDDFANAAGAVYVFVRSGGTWSQQAYVKASNTAAGAWFGDTVALGGDGNRLVVTAAAERGGSSGVDGDQTDQSMNGAGAAYVFDRDGGGTWTQRAYLKASNPDELDLFGTHAAISEDGSTIAVSAWAEDSAATGIGGDQADDAIPFAGAVYVFQLDGAGSWTQRSYVKSPNTDAEDRFGKTVSLSGDGHTMAVGGHFESSEASGIGGDQSDDSLSRAGAAYLY